jgi:subtilisin family serine protease
MTQNKGANGRYDMNVEGAWALGYTGKGVVVSILDDGIQPNHPDLIKNYVGDSVFDYSLFQKVI